jgi:hypothetical protein
MSRCLSLAVAATILAPLAVYRAVAQAPQMPTGFAAFNVQPIAYSDLAGRPAFKLAIREVGGRWYLYMGLWQGGWGILDVTDPAAPTIATFVDEPEGGTSQMELAGDTMIGTLAGPDGGITIWDIKEPLNPRKVGQYRISGGGTHRNFYAGGRYVHLAASIKGFVGSNIYVIVDIADPARPKEVGRWWVPGQNVAAGETPSDPDVWLHGPPYVIGSTAYLPYGGAGMIILDISDVTRPRLVGQLDFSPPFNSWIGTHTVQPVPERNLALVNSEPATASRRGPGGSEDCKDLLEYAGVVDISDPAKPWLVSLFPRPVPPPNAPYSNFCDKGGRFGPHNMNEHLHHPDVEKQGDLVYLTYFNAGLRIFDIADPRQPTEVGYFIPPDPTTRYMRIPTGKLVAQTDDVLVDRRGVIYISDENQGIWILRYAGPRRAAVPRGQ